MKKIITIIFVLFLTISVVNAKCIKEPTIKFNGNKYYLLYSAKSSDSDGYLNEYYKNGETYNLWSEMVAVHHFPNAYSPIDRIKQFRDYLALRNCPSALTFNDKKNIAVIDFLLIHQINGRTLMEFNVFKYEKSKKCGSNAIQYARRYVATNAMEVEQIKRHFEKNRKPIINEVKRMRIPEIITEPVDRCKIESEILGVEKENNTAETFEEEAKNIETPKNTSEDDIKTESNDTTEIIEEKTNKEDNATLEETTEQKVNELNTDNDVKTVNEVQEVEIVKKNDEAAENPLASEIKEESKASEEVEIKKDEKQIADKQKKAKNIKNKKDKSNDTKVKKQKKQKEVVYQVVNDKSEFDSRTYKKSKKKVNRKKEAKERAKRAQEKLKDAL